MKSPLTSLAWLFVLCACSPCTGAELMLRDRATQHGTVIRLGDIADISAESPAETKELASVPLLPAPAAGTKQYLSMPQLRDLLIARGFRASQLSFKGAAVVQLGGANLQPAKVQKQPRRPRQSQQELERRILRAIEQCVVDTTNHQRWSIELLLDEKTLAAANELKEMLQAKCRTKIRSGREQFILTDATSGTEIHVAANLSKIQSVVVARRRIERGQLLRPADVELVDREGHLPSTIITQLEQVLGKETQRAFNPAEIIQQNNIRAATLVRRGETVNVFVRTGGVTVRSRAVAKEDGALGDLIALESLEGKKRLDASVAGPGEVLIHATGGRATDYASLGRNDVRRR